MMTTVASPFTVIAQNLSYTPHGKTEPLFAEVNFHLLPGEMMCLGGINGTGKSTLLNVLAGISSGTTRGELRIHDDAVSGSGYASTDKQHMTALLLQDADMQIIGSTVGEDLLLTANLLCSRHGNDQSANSTNPDALAMEYATRFMLDHFWQTASHQLSYGQKQKLCLAVALMQQPKLLLLDEPFNGLDYPASLELVTTLQSFLEQGMSIIVSSHDFTELAALASSALFLSPTLPPRFGLIQDVFSHAQAYGIRPVIFS